MTDYTDMIKKLNRKDFDKKKLIGIHIRLEKSAPKKNTIDKYHTLLYRGYSTHIGYNRRFDKYNSNADLSGIFPHGIGILGVSLIMLYHKDEDLARIESSLSCIHEQSLLACEAVITLFKHRDMERVKEVLKDDKILLSTCFPDIQTNLKFCEGWCRHYLLVLIYGFNEWDIYLQGIEILKTIYDIGAELNKKD